MGFAHPWAGASPCTLVMKDAGFALLEVGYEEARGTEVDQPRNLTKSVTVE